LGNFFLPHSFVVLVNWKIYIVEMWRVIWSGLRGL
jgi:hypothetical protein